MSNRSRADVSRSGEAALIGLIEKVVRKRGHLNVGIGDDACVLKDGTVLTTDAYAEGVHFALSYMTMREAGFRSACGALSDVVAMGAMPRVLLVALCLPGAVGRAEVRDLYFGIEEACRLAGCEVAGGDIIRSEQLVLAFTAVGRARRPRLRSAARAGERLYVTGHPGAAEAGRLALKHGLGRKRFAGAVTRHLRPIPRYTVMLRLRSAMGALIDTSDGIATDARHLAEQSRVKVVIEPDRLPLSPDTRDICARLGLDPLRFALSAGEDYDLLFTSSRRIPECVAGVAVSEIGRVESGRGLYSRRAGKTAPLLLTGYDHLSGAAGGSGRSGSPAP